MGGPGARRVPVMEALFQCSLLQLLSLGGKGCIGKGNSLSMYPSAPRSLSTHPHVQKNDDVCFILVLKYFLAFAWPCRYTLSGLRDVQRCVFLIMYPFIGFSQPCTLRTKFSLRTLFYAAPRQGSAGPGASRLKGAQLRLCFLVSTFLALDFSRVGAVEAFAGAIRERVQ